LDCGLHSRPANRKTVPPAGAALLQSVRFLALPRTHAVGHFQSFDRSEDCDPDDRFQSTAVLRRRPFEYGHSTVTWLAAKDLKSPIALMTILTPERQWFKSRHGLAMPDTPRSWAFCNHTVLQWDVLEFRNLAKHESFADNPAVAG